jgi:hypothetical protein
MFVAAPIDRERNMTEAELIGAMTSFFDLGISTFGLWLTLTSGYLIVAYVAGKQLPRIQFSVLNGLYILTASICALSSGNYALMGVEYQNALGGLAQTGSLTGPGPIATGTPNLVPMLFAAGLFAGELAAVYFMWSTRRSSGVEKHDGA